MIVLDKLEDELKKVKIYEEQLIYLSEFYPSLYIFVLRRLNRTAKLEEYMLKCRKCMNDPNNYHYHVHGFFIPWLDEQRALGKLKQGKDSRLLTLLLIAKTKVTIDS